MKSPPMTGSSGSSDSKKIVTQRTAAGVEKSLTRAKSVGTLGQTTRKDSPPREGKTSPRERKKWPRERKKSYKKTVRKVATEAREDEGSKIEVEGIVSADDYDVKGAMAEIYFDLQRIAAGQFIGSLDEILDEILDVIPDEIPDEMDWCRESDVTDAELREVSVGVKSIISKFSYPSSKSTTAC